MSAPDKLPLLQRAMALLVDQLDGRDRVAIVAYAGCDRLVLPPTAGSDRKTLLAAIDTLESGGSTHASQGIVTAYELARQTFMPGGNNRVILASDGDFNVGLTSRGDLEKLIERERQSGVYLTLLGFGEGNYHDDTMEILADRGNGNYAYIDSLLEARKGAGEGDERDDVRPGRRRQGPGRVQPGAGCRLPADRLRESGPGRRGVQRRPQGCRGDRGRPPGDRPLRGRPCRRRGSGVGRSAQVPAAGADGRSR